MVFPKLAALLGLSERHKARPPKWPPAPVPSLEDVKRGVVCPYDVRIYVYEFPEELPFSKMTRTARAKPGGTHFDGEHLLAQFTLEFILADFFEQACVRTMDPEKADFYFVPFYSDIEYRNTGRPDDASEWGDALLRILEKNDTSKWMEKFQVTDEYWKKYPERHILTQAAPVTGWRHPKGKRGFAHYMIQLTAPIFLSVEVTKSWIFQYPHCAAKNIVLPYPIPGRQWHDRNGSDAWENLGKQLHPNRPLFALFKGGRNHGCVNVRKAIGKAIDKDSEIQSEHSNLDAAWSRFRPRQKNQPPLAPRQALMHLATFCPCPEGDSPSAKRQYDAILAGCVPVLVSDDAVYAYDEFASPWARSSHPFALNVTDYALVVSEQDAIDGKLLDYLKSDEVLEKLPTLQANGRQRAALFRYYAPGDYPRDPLPDRRYPDGGAPALLVWDLDRRKRLDQNLRQRWDNCLAELQNVPHYTHTKQFCGDPPRDSELTRLQAMLKRTPPRSQRHAQLQRAISDYESGHVFRWRSR